MGWTLDPTELFWQEHSSKFQQKPFRALVPALGVNWTHQIYQMQSLPLENTDRRLLFVNLVITEPVLLKPKQTAELKPLVAYSGGTWRFSLLKVSKLTEGKHSL
ncbi:hypothetical protein ATANTOWER_029516 [Ataeniobius toweri]|uniref:Uncharacterized protein n=1 Tax=Ataeniobius toweri TaxID=208326 RepID=A0ABU7CDR6_9TELE|nr:hypothetical protein [Ataeniobius toweri]